MTIPVQQQADRMHFVCTPDGECIATTTAWFAGNSHDSAAFSIEKPRTMWGLPLISSMFLLNTGIVGEQGRILGSFSAVSFTTWG